MTSSGVPKPDVVDELLRVEGPRRGDRIRWPLLAQTTAVIRRRCWVRRLGLVAALTGCYLAGIATVQARKGFTGASAGTVVEEKVLPEDDRVERGQPTPKRPESPEMEYEFPVDRPNAPGAAVAGAEVDEIRRAGDRFLEEKGDVLAALDSYTRALDQASPDELAISPDEDNWLLMAIKLDRIEENRNGNQGT